MMWYFEIAIVGLLALVVYVLQMYLRLIINIFLEVSVKAPPEELEDLPGEHLTLRTKDGQHLSAVLVSATRNPARGTIVFLHEYGSDLRSAAKYAPFLPQAGFNLFAFDFRGHGGSTCPADFVPRQWITDREILDLDAAINYLHRRGLTPVGLLGISRGGVAAAIKAAQDFRVAAVVTDGAFSTAGTVLEYILKWVAIFAVIRVIYRNLPIWFYRSLAYLAVWTSEVRLRLRFPSLEKALRRRKAALFMVHGLEDTYIDYRQANFLYALAAEPKELWLVPQARHNESATIRPEEYAERVTEFFAREFVGAARASKASTPRGERNEG